jgi:hypothetical protein
MNKKRIFQVTIVLGLAGLLVFSCKKDEPNPPAAQQDSDTSAASDNSIAESIYGNVAIIADQAASGTLILFPNSNGHEELSFEKSSCATVTHDSTSTPRSLTIDFGTTNCLCADGRNRRGIIHVSYEGHYRDSAAVHQITFTDYFVNDHHVEGTKTVTNMGHNSSGNLTYAVSVNGTITKPNDGGSFTWNSERTREWIEGESTWTWTDDVYLIEGTANGTRSDGTSYEAVITTPLRKEVSCRWISAGVLDFTPSNKPTRTIDYGNTGCDYNATCTINGYVFNIILQ